MALIICPECSGMLSDKAFICPHCGFPRQQAVNTMDRPKRGRMRRPNGSGTIVPIRGKRRTTYQVRINTRIDERGYPVYHVLGRFPDRVSAEIALSEYNKDPYDPDNRNRTFQEVFAMWYQWKFKIPHTDTTRKTSSQNCALAAFRKCEAIHDRLMPDIKPTQLQEILNRTDLSYSMLEHVKSLFSQMYAYAMQYEIVSKNCAQYVKITKEDDTESGIPFTDEELALLWQNRNIPFVDTILIYCYSGWRINELAKMPLEDINLEERTFTGGLKTRHSKNRVVPIHPAIFEMVQHRLNPAFKSLIYHDGSRNIYQNKYRECFNDALLACSILTAHTPHDCRHTFNQLLDRAGVDRVTRYKLMGHIGKDINENVYTHKTLDQLREAIEQIKVKP